jgi:hypothetical protein
VNHFRDDVLGEDGVALVQQALGETIEVDDRAFTIIGVMPREFQFPAPETLLWLPITTNRYRLDQPV